MRQSSLGSEFEDVIVNESSSSNNKLQLAYELTEYSFTTCIPLKGGRRSFKKRLMQGTNLGLFSVTT